MKVLFYLAETQSVDETRVKAEMLFWWAKVREVQVVGAVCLSVVLAFSTIFFREIMLSYSIYEKGR